MHWARYPFFRITAGLILGILLFNAFIQENIPRYLLLLFSVIISGGYIVTLICFIRSAYKIWHGIFSALSFTLLGFLSAYLSVYPDKPYNPDEITRTTTHYTATIRSKPVATEKTVKYEVLIDQMKHNEVWIKTSDKAILYFLDADIPEFDFGGKVLVKGHPEVLKSRRNPHAFEYSRYLQRKGIYLQHFITNDDYIHVRNAQEYSLKYISMKIGDCLENILSEYIQSERELNMAKAMVLGRREEITMEMEFVYQSTGTSHILAVSGLHVGIVYLVFSSIFRFLKNSRFRWIYYAIPIFAIWSYAFITGLSPSVLRASTMISIILLAELTSRNSNIYNSILVSAFFILLLSPNLLFSVSFQLSYMAVLGIVYMYKMMYRLLYVKSKILNFFWKITVLSLAVQIATFPITIYYFNQFPALFPLANLLAIPTAAVVLVGSMLLLSVSFLDFIPEIIGTGLKVWIYIYNESLVFISKLPFALIDDLYLKPVHVFITILCVLLFVRFWETRKLRVFRYFTYAISVMSLIVLIDHATKSNQSEITFYSIQGRFYYDVFLGKTCFSNIESPNEKAKSEVHFNITPNRKYHLITDVQPINNLTLSRNIGKNQLLIVHNKTILIIREIESLTQELNGMPVDYLVVNKNSIKDLNMLMHYFRFETLILDGTIPNDVFVLTSDDQLKNVPEIHSLAENGAYVIDI